MDLKYDQRMFELDSSPKTHEETVRMTEDIQTMMTHTHVDRNGIVHPKVSKEALSAARSTPLYAVNNPAVDSLGKAFMSEGALFVKYEEGMQDFKERALGAYLCVLAKAPGVSAESLASAFHLPIGFFENMEKALGGIPNVPAGEISRLMGSRGVENRITGKNGEGYSTREIVTSYEMAEELGRNVGAEMVEAIKTGEDMELVCSRYGSEFIESSRALPSTLPSVIVTGINELMAVIMKGLPDLTQSLGDELKLKIEVKKSLAKGMSQADAFMELERVSVVAALSEVFRFNKREYDKSLIEAMENLRKPRKSPKP